MEISNRTKRQVADKRQAANKRPAASRRWATRLLAAVALISTIAVLAMPSPYVILQPGPVFDALGQTTVNGSPTDMVSISGADSYHSASDGSLYVLTVSQLGSPDGEPSWFQVISVWLDGAQKVVPMNQAYPPGTTSASENADNALAMQESQDAAVAAALTQLGYQIPATLVVASVLDGSHANGVLQAGDEIVSINGTAVSTVEQVRALAAAASAANPLIVTYRRSGVENTVSIAPMTYTDGTQLLGITPTIKYTFPFTVTISLQNVGGPSAGLIFALSVIDRLTPGSLTGGNAVAGTGTISADGTVGAIGGIQQKMVSASRAGATLFLAPASNCDEVVGHVPSGLSVVSVSTLSDALSDIKSYAANGSTAGLPTCTAD